MNKKLIEEDKKDFDNVINAIKKIDGICKLAQVLNILETYKGCKRRRFRNIKD